MKEHRRLHFNPKSALCINRPDLEVSDIKVEPEDLFPSESAGPDPLSDAGREITPGDDNYLKSEAIKEEPKDDDFDYDDPDNEEHEIDPATLCQEFMSTEENPDDENAGNFQRNAAEHLQSGFQDGIKQEVKSEPLE